MKTGYIISGLGHGVLILWLLVGGLFLRAPDEPLLQVAEVSLVSAAEFAAMTEGPQDPATPAVAPPPRPEPEPAPEPDPEPPAPQAEPEPTPPEPEPMPAPEPETPPEAPRVADEIIAPPDEPLPPGPELIEDTTPEETAEPEPAPVEELPAQAPEATTTEIVTEAETPSETTSAAPKVSPRPRAKPVPPPIETAEPAPEPTPAPTIDDAIEGALAEALDEATAPEPATAPAGPPLTRGEQDGLRIAVQKCWNVGSLSTDALATTVVVLVRMAPRGVPESVELKSSNGASATATERAYEAARRAVIRCGAQGFPLPAEKYEQWREIEMTFDPTNMRIK